MPGNLSVKRGCQFREVLLYSNQFPEKHADVMQSFDAFTFTVWIMIIVSAISMMLLISSSQVLAMSQRITIRKWTTQKGWLLQQV